jgi:hypothetical protein
MQTIRVREKTGKDGTLHLDIPLGTPELEFEVVIIVHPTEPSENTSSAAWPVGYFEKTYGSITDETFARPPQPEMPKPVDLE